MQDKDLAALKVLAEEVRKSCGPEDSISHGDKNYLTAYFAPDFAKYVIALIASAPSLISRIESQDTLIEEYKQAAFQMGEASADAASRCRAQGGNTSDKASPPSPAVDLSGLTRYGYYGIAGMRVDSLGDYLKLTDVQALLAAGATCATCRGSGEVGGFEGGAAPGFVSYPCPDCAAPARDVGGLTDERIAALYEDSFNSMSGRMRNAPKPNETVFVFARAIEREVLATKEAEQDTKGIKEQAEAWLAVCATLDELRFGWRFRGCNGMAGAINTIRSLATSPAPSASQGEVKVPEGFKLVPIAPTPAMLLAGVKGFQKAGYNDCDKLHDWAGCYAAMIAAAPSVTDGEGK